MDLNKNINHEIYLIKQDVKRLTEQMKEAIGTNEQSIERVNMIVNYQQFVNFQIDRINEDCKRYKFEQADLDQLMTRMDK